MLSHWGSNSPELSLVTRRALLTEAEYFGVPSLVETCWSGFYELEDVVAVATTEMSEQPPPAQAFEFKGQTRVRLHPTAASAPLPALWLNHPPILPLDGSGDYLERCPVPLDLAKESLAVPPSPSYDVKVEANVFVVPSPRLYGRYSESLDTLRT